MSGFADQTGDNGVRIKYLAIEEYTFFRLNRATDKEINFLIKLSKDACRILGNDGLCDLQVASIVD